MKTTVKLTVINGGMTVTTERLDSDTTPIMTENPMHAWVGLMQNIHKETYGLWYTLFSNFWSIGLYSGKDK